ncbi:MAG: cobalt ECF transporter T component CbiQ [Firmicutes bacterium]|nr:cobalt ECF transporter T component CbiQ [Bacillota bacterium]
MKLQLDRYAYLETPLHSWDPRYKLVGFMTLIFAFSFVDNLQLLPFMVAVSGLLYAVSQLPLSFLLARMRLPGFFLLMMGVLLPFISGSTVLLHLGPLSVKQEGCLDLLLIAVKFVSILTMGIILFGTSPFLTNVKAMRALGLPSILADMILFTYRYLYDISDNLKTMQTAMKLRGFQGHNLRSVVTLASLAGTILVRSYEQSDRVYKAMTLRGYGQADVNRGGQHEEEFEAYSRDLWGLIILLLVAAAFVVGQILIR